MGILAGQGQQAEREARNEDAVRSYIKLVDVLLLLARESGDHPTWSQYAKQAETYQNKARALIPPDQLKNLRPFKVPEPPVSDSTKNPEKQISADNQSENTPDAVSKGTSSFKRIFKPFQKNENNVDRLEQDSVREDQWRSAAATPQPFEVPQVGEVMVGKENMVSSDAMQRVMEESRKVQEQLGSKIREKEDRISSLQAEIRELKERLRETVPRSEYQALQGQLIESISRAEFDRLREDLMNSVPRSQYEQLLNRFSNTVPRDLYLAAELKAARLEAELKIMLPRSVIDDLSSQIALLSTLAGVPVPEMLPEQKEAQGQEPKQTQTPDES